MQFHNIRDVSHVVYPGCPVKWVKLGSHCYTFITTLPIGRAEGIRSKVIRSRDYCSQFEAYVLSIENQTGVEQALLKEAFTTIPSLADIPAWVLGIICMSL
jgi:hypothetical protein